MLKSAGKDLEHGPMQGKQEYSSTDETQWPIYKPMPKLEAVVQTTGEAQYTNDIPHFDKELFAAFVHTTVANATLKSVDASEALVIIIIKKIINHLNINIIFR
jgi:xanthine dehydrogenase/oxidase